MVCLFSRKLTRWVKVFFFTTGLGTIAIGASLPAQASEGPVPSDPFLRLELGGHSAGINRIIEMNDGRQILTVSDDQTARIWDAETGENLRTLRGAAGGRDEGALYAVALSNRFLALAGRTGWDWGNGTTNVRVLSSDGKKPLGVLSGLPSPVSSLAISHDEKFIAVGLLGEGQGVRVFKLGVGSPLLVDAAFSGDVVDLEFLPSGELVVISNGGTLNVYSGTDFSKLGSPNIYGAKNPWRLTSNSAGNRIIIAGQSSLELEVRSGLTLSKSQILHIPDTQSDVVGGLASAVWTNAEKFIHAISDPVLSKHDGETTKAQHIHSWESSRGIYRGKMSLAALGVESTIVALKQSFVDPQRILFGCNDGSWGYLVVDNDGTISLGRLVTSSVPSYAGLYNTTISTNFDGTAFSLPHEFEGDDAAVFSAADRSFEADFGDEDVYKRSRQSVGNSVEISSVDGSAWLNGAPLDLDPNERALDASFLDESDRLAVGTNFYLRLFSGAELLWKQGVAAPVWGVLPSGDAKTLILYLGNGIIEWRNAEDGRLLRSVFIRRGALDWVMWTPEGFFDHSRANSNDEVSGVSLVGYQINNGYKAEADFITISQMYKKFYRPDIVQASLLKQDGDDEILIEASKSSGTISELVSTGKPAKIEVLEVCGIDEFDYPAGCVAFSKDQTEGTVTTSDLGDVVLPRVVRDTDEVEMIVRVENGGSGIGDIRIKRNSFQISGENGELIERGDYQIRRLRVPLVPGENRIKLSVSDAKSVMFSPEVAFKLHANFALDSNERTIFVLAVGVADYEIDAFDLQQNVASNDAVAIAEIIELSGANGLFDAASITVLENEKATRQAIVDALQALSERADPNDTVLVFLSGHGDVVDGNYIFAPADLGTKRTELIADAVAGRRFGDAAVRDVFRTEGLSQATIGSALSQVNSERLIVVLDTCYAGAFQTLDPVQRKNRSDAVMDRVNLESGRFVLASARGLANDSDGKDYPTGQGHGLFTSAALEALSGEADIDQDNLISLAELGQYVRREVAARSKSWNVPQVPVVKFQGDPFFALTKYSSIQ